MLKPVVLAVDQGTTNTKALLITGDGGTVARASRPMHVDYPQPGWAEQSANHIWQTVTEVISELRAQADGYEIRALAISNQRESVVLWDAASGEAIGPCVLWQCRRSSQRCAALRDQGHEANIVTRSGLGLDPLFPAAKIAWLLDNIEGARARAERGELRAGTVDSWLIWKLTGGRHVTDCSNASRTQLFNLKTLAWDETLAALFDVPMALLPEVLLSDGEFGVTTTGAAPAGIPIRGVMGDSHAALYGHGGVGHIKASCGTGSSLMLATDQRIHSKNGLSSTIAWGRRGVVLHALEGNILVSGQTAAFATTLLGLHDQQALTDLAQEVPDNGGVSFVPALAGLGAPHWSDQARGMICGMSLGTRPAHVARAALEAIALQIRDVFCAMEADLDAKLPSLSVDGRASKNDFLMQTLANLLDRPVLRGDDVELAAVGAAKMAAEALGFWSGAAHGTLKIFAPSADGGCRDAIIAQWQDAVRRVKLHNAR